jgi:hypothetical protein
MDLRRRLGPVRALAIGVALTGASGCLSTDPSAQYSRGAIILPATLLEAYSLAEELALDWSPNAFVTSLGGGFTVMDETGGARNHSFVFHARDRFTHRRLTVHLFGGSPWMIDAAVGPPPARFVDFEEMIDSDVAVAAAINLAELANSVTPDSISVPEEFAARLLSTSVWPEAAPGDQVAANTVAWRVDFLELDVLEQTEVPVYWSTARFYFDPYTGELLGEPVFPASGREIYPFP